MRSRSFAIVPALVAGFAMTGIGIAVSAETPEPGGEGRSGSSAAESQEQERSPAATPGHQQQDPSDRERDTRGRDLPPVGAQGTPGAADPSASQRAGTAGGDYVVEQGDTLASIAEKELGNAEQWKQIAKMNQIDDPDRLEVGTRLRLPERSKRQETGSPESSPARSTSSRPDESAR